MPSVEMPCAWEDIFAAARRLASDPGLRHLVFVRQNQSLLCLACPEPGSLQPEYVAQVERIVPSGTRRAIAVIAPTQPKWEAGDEKAIPGTQDVIALGRAIPFLGMLSGFTAIGHSVWVFDGAPDTMAAGCRDADLLLIDSIKATTLTTKSVDQATEVMRNANVLIHDRSKGSLAALRLAGGSPGRLEFR